MQYSQKEVDLANQVVVPYFEQGAPTGIPLILLHGFTDSWHTFECLFP